MKPRSYYIEILVQSATFLPHYQSYSALLLLGGNQEARKNDPIGLLTLDGMQLHQRVQSTLRSKLKTSDLLYPAAPLHEVFPRTSRRFAARTLNTENLKLNLLVVGKPTECEPDTRLEIITEELLEPSFFSLFPVNTFLPPFFCWVGSLWGCIASRKNVNMQDAFLYEHRLPWNWMSTENTHDPKGPNSFCFKWPFNLFSSSY